MMRYEVLLPLEFNNGRTIHHELFLSTLKEIRGKFGAVSFEEGKIAGQWVDDNGKLFTDLMHRAFVDVSDEEQACQAIEWFRAHKEIWKKRFQQEEIWLVCYSVERI